MVFEQIGYAKIMFKLIREKVKAPGKGFEPMCAEAQPLPCFDLEAVAVPLG